MKCILIGGGEIGRGNTSYELQEIDKEIKNMTQKETPTLLFIGLASDHADSYYKKIKENYQALGCKTTYLKKTNLENNPSISRDKIKQADIIYIGGGDTIKLLEKVKKYDLEKDLKEAAKRNCIMVGISAGAILLSKKGYSDSYILRGESDKYQFIDGLGILDIKISPHYHETDEKTKQLEEALKMKKEVIYGIENKAALKVIDQDLSQISCFKKKVYQVTYDKKLKEKALTGGKR